MNPAADEGLTMLPMRWTSRPRAAREARETKSDERERRRFRRRHRRKFVNGKQVVAELVRDDLKVEDQMERAAHGRRTEETERVEPGLGRESRRQHQVLEVDMQIRVVVDEL